MKSGKNPKAGAPQDDEVKDLTAKLQQMTDLAARAQADLQNAKIRMQKDSDDLRKFASEGFIRILLPTIDTFYLAFQHLPDDLKNHEWVKGVIAIEQELLRRLGEMGLSKMECLGQQVDTDKHEVVTLGSGEEGVILEVLENGYELHGKVLRPAKVIVGSGAA